MALVKNTYGLPETTLSNFDWYDLATGTGYKDFYGMDLIEGSNSTIYVLTSNVYYAHIGWFNSPDTASELNFDLDLEVPLTIDGVVIINAPIFSFEDLAVKIFTFKIYRVDSGGGEHQLGSTVTANIDLDASENRIITIKFDVDITRLKAGEKFRLSVANPASGGGTSLFWLFDPKNRDALGGTMTGATLKASQLKISLPIKI